ncbi:hypothetical protein ACQJBY_033188 [Aegilops geniculata]
MRAHALGGRLHRSRHSGVVVVWRLGLGAPVSPASDMGGRDQEPKDADSLEYSDQQTRFGIPIIETKYHMDSSCLLVDNPDCFVFRELLC